MEYITITERALAKIKEVAVEEAITPDLVLRIFVNGGGCSGFQYGFTFDEVVNDDDIYVENSDVKVVVDPISVQYLTGAVVDFVEDVMGAQFVITNPNAVTTCGCGASFSA